MGTAPPASNRIARPLHVERQGTEGPVMLFIHGNPYDHRLWLFQTAHFSNGFRTLAVDLPSYGRSPPVEAGVSISDMAEACWAIVDGVTTESVILAGNSIGASIALRMAMQRRDRVRGMILTGAGYLPDRSFARQAGAEWREHGIAARGATFEFFTGSVGRGPLRDFLHQMFAETDSWIDAGSVCAMFTALEEPEPEAMYDGISQPCLMISGTEDPVHEAALAFKHRVPGAELQIMEGASHVPNLDDPARWNALSLDFLRRHGLNS